MLSSSGLPPPLSTVAGALGVVVRTSRLPARRSEPSRFPCETAFARQRPHEQARSPSALRSFLHASGRYTDFLLTGAYTPPHCSLECHGIKRTGQRPPLVQPPPPIPSSSALSPTHRNTTMKLALLSLALTALASVVHAQILTPCLTRCLSAAGSEAGCGT